MFTIEPETVIKNALFFNEHLKLQHISLIINAQIRCISVHSLFIATQLDTQVVPHSYGTRGFIRVFQRTCCLSQMNPVLILTPNFFKIYIYIPHAFLTSVVRAT
jgi:hypothetical protein